MDTQMQGVQREDMSLEQRRELGQILDRFIDAYGEKVLEQTDEQWLQARLLAELPELGAETAGQYSRETVAAIQSYDETLASLNLARKNGRTVAEWFSRRTRWACGGMGDSEYASKMLVFHASMEQVTQVHSADRALLDHCEEVAGEEVSAAEAEKLANMTGELVRLAGLQSVVEISEYVEQTRQTEQAESPRESAAVIHALETGETRGLKTAVAGALTTASHRRVIRIVTAQSAGPVPVEVCAGLAGMAVENARTSVQLGQKKISAAQAVDQKAANAAAFVTRVGIRAVGGSLSKAAGLIPIIGPVAKTAVFEATRAVEKKASAKVTAAVERANGPVAKLAKEAVARASDAVQAAAKAAADTTKRLVSGIKSKLAGLIHR